MAALVGVEGLFYLDPIGQDVAVEDQPGLEPEPLNFIPLELPEVNVDNDVDKEEWEDFKWDFDSSGDEGFWEGSEGEGVD